MSKTLETKKRILSLLKKRDMTISGLSQELELSTATVSQHMEELQRAGAIEKVENEHFKKLKYYRASKTAGPIVASYVKYVIGAIVIIGLAAFFSYSYHGNSITHQVTTVKNTANNASTSIAAPEIVKITASNNTNTSTVAAIGGGGGLACPMLFYSLNGSIENYSGFSLYHLNSTNGPIADYVIGAGKRGELYLIERISNVLKEPENFSYNRTHYASLMQLNNSTSTEPSGINYSISPQNFTLKNNSTIYLSLNVTANSTAADNTYWLRIDGPCGGGVTPVLLTIGNRSYNGTVTIGRATYA